MLLVRFSAGEEFQAGWHSDEQTRKEKPRHLNRNFPEITINSEPIVGELHLRWKEYHSAAIRQSRFDDLAVVGSPFDKFCRHPDTPPLVSTSQ